MSSNLKNIIVLEIQLVTLESAFVLDYWNYKHAPSVADKVSQYMLVARLRGITFSRSSEDLVITK